MFCGSAVGQFLPPMVVYKAKHLYAGWQEGGPNGSASRKMNGNLSFDPKVNAGIFKDFFSKLAGNLLNNLPNPTNKFGLNSVKVYYEKQHLLGKMFSFTHITEEIISGILNKTNPAKAAGIDKLSGKFLKDGNLNFSFTYCTVM